MGGFAKLFEEAQQKKKTSKSSEKDPKEEKRQTKIVEKQTETSTRKSPKSSKKFAKGKTEQGGGTNNRKRRRDQGPKKRPVTQEALELSRVLQETSRKKLLNETLQIFWDSKHDGYRDVHHACIVVDTCARCGSPERAQKVVDKLVQKGAEMSIQVHTALIKGYAHGGDLHAAMNVFETSCQASQPIHLQPNVRTLNTLLRGCLWTASTEIKDGKVAGGVVSSEQAWKMFVDVVGDDKLDASSYEYSVTLLTQALRIKSALQRIKVFETTASVRWKGKASLQGKADQVALETLAVMYLGLARACACLGDAAETWLYCQRSLNCVHASRRYLQEEAASSHQTETISNQRRKPEGGKRAFKEQDEQRIASNSAYRNHKLNEIELEIKELIRNRGQNCLTKEKLRDRMLRGLLYFSGGGTTHLAHEKKNVQESSSGCPTIQTPIWTSFGFSQLFDDSEDDGIQLQSEQHEEINQPIRDDGSLAFDLVFSNDKLPLDVEIGAGYGDWIAQQAYCHKDRNHIAVELRADRVHQIFSKGILATGKPIDNLCVVGAESRFFLENLLPEQSVATIFCNHPEPPTQTYGDREQLERIQKGTLDEPAHMLTSSALTAAAACLQRNGRMVLVTDNRHFSRLLAATLCRVASQSKKPLIRPPDAQETKELAYNLLESVGGGNRSGSIPIFEGRPNSTIGHTERSTGSSYFDRLWKSGAGSHSSRQTRYILVVYRC